MDKIIRVIIVDDNILAVNNLKDKLSNNNLIKVVGLFTDGESVLNYAVNHTNEFDLIVTDLLLPKLDGKALLEELQRRGIHKKIIVLTNYKDDYIIKNKDRFGINHYILKPYSLPSLEQRITEEYSIKNTYRYNKYTNLESEINNLLHNLGIPSHIRGFKYIKEGIEILYFSESVTLITKEVYPRIAFKYETTPSRVERAIRHAIEVSCIRGNYELLDELFGYSVSCDKSKPTNAEFLTTVVDKLKTDISV